MNNNGALPSPNPALENLPPYVIGRSDQPIDLVLDFNECTSPPSSVGPRDHRYPDLQSPLEAEIANDLNLDYDQVLVTCGADDALQRAVFAVGAAGREAVLLEPGYSMIRRFVTLSGATAVPVEWWYGDLPVSEINNRTTDNTSLIAVVSPNNPTGAVATRKAVSDLLACNPTTLVLVDQAYLEFADPEFDLLPTVLAHPNGIMIRTFSKAWGAAGLRVGFAVGNATVIAWMRRVGLPFPVSRPATESVRRLLKAGPDSSRISKIRDQRQRLQTFLTRLGAETWPSQGSFVLARFADVDLVWNGLATFGIAVRRFATKPQLEGCLRFTLPGDEDSYQRLESVLTTILAPQAVLFDMDGVLVDVSRSYRSAIKSTAATFGVTVSDEDIRAIKAAGNATNDWLVTQRLLSASGVDIALDHIVERFESAYQGNSDAPGFRRFESPIIGRQTLESLASRLPLAVVTGRPRADAERFLAQNQLNRYFKAVVCMEDATSKPDPEPVQKALDILNVDHAWMVGDTPDDIASARAAGVLPIGVPAPGEPSETVNQVLWNAGAARVLTTAAEITEVLP